MSYPTNTSKILTAMGYIAESDYYLTILPDGTLSLDWQIDSHPTEEEVIAFGASQEYSDWWFAATKKEGRIAIREWAASINGRAYEDQLPAAIDNIITQDVRQAVRQMLNAFAAENGLSQQVSAAESKAAFKTRERFNLILMAGEARKEVRNTINAETDLATLEAYVAAIIADGDAVAVAAHASAYPDADPTLETLLATYPADYE